MGIKQGLTAVLLGIVLFGRPAPAVFGQQRNPRDLILVLDTSAAMSAYYQDINRYLCGPFLHDNLRLGDTFHLISFSDRSRMEIARRIEGRGDLETIIGRMLLMYPLDPPPDLSAALLFAENYIRGLDSRRQKKMILLSLGNEPEGGSLETLAAETRLRLAGQNTSFEYADPRTLPRTPVQAAQRPAVTAVPAQTTPAPPPRPVTPTAPVQTTPVQSQPTQRAAVPAVPAQTTPEPSQTAQRPVTPTAPVQPPTAPGQAAQRPAVPITPAQTAQRPVTPSTVPAQTTPVPGQAAQRPAASAQTTPVPSPGPVTSTAPVQTTPEPSQTAQRPVTPAAPVQTAQRPAPSKPAVPRTVLADIYTSFLNSYKPLAGLLILAVLGLGAFFLVRYLHRSPNRAAARAAGEASAGRARTAPRETAPPAEAARVRQTRPSRETPYANTGGAPKKIEYGSPLMIKLFVADQNTFIGKRNTHLVKPGLSYTVGGGKSDFLIFLVRVPPHIGELRYGNSACSFHPRRPEYFPDTGAEPVQDCIGKTIRIISDKGYELFIRLELYEDPLIELNRLMHSIRVPSALDV